MANVSVDAYVLDALMPDLVGHDRQPSAFVVYLFLWRATGGGRRALQASLLDVVAATGLSKRAVQAAIKTLARRRLVDVARAGITAVPVYTLRRPWLR